MFTQSDVRRMFDYRDGLLFWKLRIAPHIRVGSEAGYLCNTGPNCGRVRVGIKGRLYFAHRLVFLYHHGYMPENDIDHIDRNPSNNRIENLREVSHSCNLRNSKQQANNTSGIRGISWHNQAGKWKARVKIFGKDKHLGIHADFTEAVAHRLAAEQCLGWPGCNESSPAFKYIQNQLGKTKS